MSHIETALASRELVTTTVTRFEVLCGAVTAGTLAEAERLLRPIECLPFDLRAANTAAELHRTLRAGGISLSPADTMIAGIAVSRGVTLVTRNRRHFDRVPGLAVEAP